MAEAPRPSRRRTEEPVRPAPPAEPKRPPASSERPLESEPTREVTRPEATHGVPSPPAGEPVLEGSRIPETPAALPAAPKPAPVARDTPDFEAEIAAVQRVLERYEQAYDQLDAGGAASVWPSVDSRALARVFARLERQDLSFDSCVFAVSEAHATAECNGSLTYVPRVGKTAPHNERHSWTIELTGMGDAWRIVHVSAR